MVLAIVRLLIGVYDKCNIRDLMIECLIHLTIVCAVRNDRICEKRRRRATLYGVTPSSPSTISEWCLHWKLAEQQLNHLGSVAETTFRYWRRPGTLNETKLKTASRLVLWIADAGEEQCAVKNITSVKPKSYLRRAWSSLAVFNDVVAVSEKRDFQIYKFPLVWVEPLLKDNRHCVRVYTPEDELHVEFNDAAAKARVIVAEEIDEIEIHVYPGEEVGALQDLSEKLWWRIRGVWLAFS
ncbi:unnamed protein product [Toxocara canis]|uniref:Transposase n=1 Tax=Toxocara canis TaxID=6265 RepID=A0A183V0T9_TOXCA|nr:unnamed protein product [Toxocara canis]